MTPRKIGLRRRAAREDAAPLLIRTKLEPPAAPEPEIAREALLAPFRRDPRWRVLLLRAPSGYGKTELLRQLYRDADQPGSVRAWLELDREDDDPRRLLRYVAATLARAGLLDGEHRDWAPLLQGEVDRSRHFDQLAALLAGQEAPLLLVFDACERMREPASWELLGQLVHYLPDSVRVAFGSRAEIPIAFSRERASPAFSLLDHAQLRARHEEADALLTALGLEDGEVEWLRRRCQGWWHGLRLGARTLQDLDAEAREQELQRFGGTHPVLAEFFRREGLPGDASTQRLLELAAVPECINQGLFDHLLQGASKATSLPRLLEGCPFFMPAGEHGWYQPHPLFAEFLRAEFEQRDRELLRQRHVEAAEWLGAEGRVEAAVRHALHIGDDALALGFIHRCYDGLVERGELETLSLWRGLLPENYVNRYPLVALLWAWELLVRGKRDEAVALAGNIRKALHTLAESPGSERHVREVARVDTLVAAAALRHGEVAGDGPVAPETATGRGGLECLAHAQAAAWRGDGAAEEAWLDAVGARQAQSASTFLAVLGDSFRARHYLWAGDLESALGLAQLSERRLESDQERRLLGRLPWLVQLQVLWERNEAGFPVEALRETLRAAHPLRPAWFAVEGWCLLAEMLSARGEDSEARAALADIRTRVDVAPLTRLLLASEIGIALRSGESRVVDELVRAAGIDHLRDDEPWSPARHASLIAAIRLALHREQADAALELVRATRAQTPAWQALARARLAALECAALHMAGQAGPARDLLLRLVGEGSRAHLVRTFTDAGPVMQQMLRDLFLTGEVPSAPLGMYINRLLAAFDAETSRRPATATGADAGGPVEQLTDREREVLRMVAEGHSNQEVSEKLFLSIGTIKWHLHNIYDKLMVRNRTQAVRRARELRWLE